MEKNKIEKGAILIAPDGRRALVLSVPSSSETIEVIWLGTGKKDSISIYAIRDYTVCPACEVLAYLLQSVLNVPVKEIITRANFEYAVKSSIPKNWLWDYSVYNPEYPIDNTITTIAFRWYLANNPSDFTRKILFC